MGNAIAMIASTSIFAFLGLLAAGLILANTAKPWTDPVLMFTVVAFGIAGTALGFLIGYVVTPFK